jgi:hypothetical protein
VLKKNKKNRNLLVYCCRSLLMKSLSDGKCF